MQLRRNESEITYEVTVRGEDGSQTYDSVLRNFMADGDPGTDTVIREKCPLPGGLRHASKETILEKLYDDIKITAYQYDRKSEVEEDAKTKEIYASYAEALRSMDYDKLQKKITIERK